MRFQDIKFRIFKRSYVCLDSLVDSRVWFLRIFVTVETLCYPHSPIIVDLDDDNDSLDTAMEDTN